MYRSHTWESKVASRLLAHRLAILCLVLGLELLLAVALAGVLWVTRVKDEFPAQGRLVRDANGYLFEAEVRAQDLDKLVVGSKALLHLNILEGQAGTEPSPVRGVVISLAEGSPGLALVRLDGAQLAANDSLRRQLDRLLASGSRVSATIETRTKRLLSLLVRR